MRSYRLLYLLIVLINFVGLFFPVHQDETVFLNMASQITKGFPPYVDNFDNKPPGIYFTLAGFISVFSRNIWKIRLFVFIINLFTAYLIFIISKKIFDDKIGKLAGLTYLILSPLYQGNFFLTEVFMNLFILLSTFMLLTFQKKQHILFIISSGLSSGIAIIFKQPAIINTVINFLFFWQLNKKTNLIKLCFFYFLGALTPWAFLTIYLVKKDILILALRQIFVYNMFSYHPWPLGKTLLALPKIIYPAIVIWLVAGGLILGKQIKLWPDQFLRLSILAVIPILSTRPYHHYWLQILPFAVIWAFRWTNSRAIWPSLLRLNILLAAVIFISYGFLTAMSGLWNSTIIAGGN